MTLVSVTKYCNCNKKGRKKYISALKIESGLFWIFSGE